MKNKIKQPCSKVYKVIDQMKNKLSFDVTTIEVEVDKNTTAFADLEVSNDYGYLELSLQGVDVVRDTLKGVLFYDNVAQLIAEELENQIIAINDNSKRNTEDWNYQVDYETIGGRFAYH